MLKIQVNIVNNVIGTKYLIIDVAKILIIIVFGSTIVLVVKIITHLF